MANDIYEFFAEKYGKDNLLNPKYTNKLVRKIAEYSTSCSTSVEEIKETINLLTSQDILEKKIKEEYPRCFLKIAAILKAMRTNIVYQITAWIIKLRLSSQKNSVQKKKECRLVRDCTNPDWHYYIELKKDL